MSTLAIWHNRRIVRTAKGSTDLVEYGQTCPESDSLPPEAITRKSRERSRKFFPPTRPESSSY
jgi:hypothetical protein